MKDGGSVVSLDFDNSVTYPVYDWMGVAKSALASTAWYSARYCPTGSPDRVRRHPYILDTPSSR